MVLGDFGMAEGKRPRGAVVHAVLAVALATGCGTTDGGPQGRDQGFTVTPSGGAPAAPVDVPMAGAAGVSGGDVGGVGGSEPISGAGGGDVVAPTDAGSMPLPEGPWSMGIELEHQPQAPGDPEAGYAYLVNGGYFGCGIPSRFFGLVGPFATLPGISLEPLPGRDVIVDGAPLPYNWNLATNEDGVDVVYMNCMQCHTGKFNGELIIGLGNADADWTTDLSSAAGAADLLALLGPTLEEQKELDKFIGRLKVIGGPAVMRTVGTNPAEMLATTFVAHRDRDTLAWSDVPLLSIPALEKFDAGQTVTSKTPPWWRMSKKHTQFYNGMGRGDHRRSEMLAGSLCTDSVEQAEAIDKHFDDVNAYIRTIKAPVYPFPIDRALADKGKPIFEETCAGCHGSYADDPEDDANDTYPNLLIPQEEIGTDPVVGLGGTTKEYGADLVDWYNNSWYGEVGSYVPFSGYVSPPLDGVWATAPYLHNGSVPDLATLLDSSKRPKYWMRNNHDTTDYDQQALGFPWTALESGQDLPPFGVAARNIYDTTQYSHGNGGHTYGDALTDEERRALIEYVKTL